MSSLSQENKSVVLMSNVRPKDTLTNFSNPLPDQFLHPHYRHRVAVSSIGLHTEFKSSAVPKNDLYPIMIQMFRKDWIRTCKTRDPSENNENSEKPLTLNMFRKQDCYFIDTNKSYTNQELHTHFENTQGCYNGLLNNKFKGFPSKFDAATNTLSFGQWDMPFKDFKYESRRQAHQTYLLFHENFVNTLGLLEGMLTTAIKRTPWNITLPNGEKITEYREEEIQVQGPDLQPVYIDKELYFWFLPAAKTFVNSLPDNAVKVQVPKLLYLMCSNVVPGLVDGSFQPLLRRFPLDFEIGAEYASFHFKNLEFIDVVSDITDSIHITICDELLRPLRLTPGFATQVSLLVKSRPQFLSKTMNPLQRFIVHVNSRATINHQDNLPHSFTAELPKTLHFQTGLWQVSLSHIVFPTKMKQLQSISFKMSIEAFSDADRSSSEVTEFVFPSTLETCSEIVAYFTEKLSETGVAKVETWPTGPMCLIFQKEAKITVNSTLAYVLGHIDLSPNAALTIDSAQAHPRSKKWVFSHKPQQMQLFPASLYIYAPHLCDFSFVGDMTKPLLSIVKVPHKALQPPVFVDHEIKDPVFHPLTYDHIKTLQFYITSHDNAPVRFANEQDNDAVVYLTLAFERKEDN